MGSAQTAVPTYTVSTFAGAAPDGDGGWAANAVLRTPGGMVFDRDGNLYVVDMGNAKIRKITPGGLITTFVGTGEAGFSGDGGPASRAQINSYLTGLKMDAAGNFYFLDAGNNRVRKVTATDNTISTYVYGPDLPDRVIAGGMIGTALDSANNLYVSAPGKRVIFKIAPDGSFSELGTGALADTGDDGPVTQAAFLYPGNLYVDASDTLYVNDYTANRIRAITSDGIIHAFAGSGKAGFSGDGGPATSALLNFPGSMTSDKSGNFYFTDRNNFRVRRIAPDGTISTFAGSGQGASSGDGGPATKAVLSPLALAVSPSGDLYITDPYTVRVVGSDGIIRTLYGRNHFTEDGQLAETAVIGNLAAVASDSQGNLYLSDGNRIRKIDRNGFLSTVAGNGSFTSNTGDGGPATSATIAFANAMVVDAMGNIYFGSASSVRRVGTDGKISTVAGTGTAGFSGDGGPATQARLAGISGLALDASGSLYISDNPNRRIRKVTPDGIIRTIGGTGASGNSGNGGPAVAATLAPVGLVTDTAGNLYVADNIANEVKLISPDGTISIFAGTGVAGETGDGGPATAARLNSCTRLAIDSGNLYITDVNGNSIRVVTPDGIIHTIASGATFPNGISSDNLADGGSFGGDGGPAIGAHYRNLGMVTFDGSGNIFVSDTGNARIRVLTPKQ